MLMIRCMCHPFYCVHATLWWIGLGLISHWFHMVPCILLVSFLTIHTLRHTMFCSCSVSALHITQASKQACLVLHCCRLFASSSRGFFILCLHNISLSRFSLCSLYFFLMVFTNHVFTLLLLLLPSLFLIHMIRVMARNPSWLVLYPVISFVLVSPSSRSKPGLGLSYWTPSLHSCV